MRIEKKKWVVFTFKDGRPEQRQEINKSVMHKDIEWPNHATSFYMITQSTVFNCSSNGVTQPPKKLETWVHPLIRKAIKNSKRCGVVS